MAKERSVEIGNIGGINGKRKEEKEKGNGTEGLILAAQEKASRLNWVKRMIDKEEECSPRCRMCDRENETVSHIVSECTQLAQNEYKKCHHDKIAAIIHWHLCRKFGFSCCGKSFEHFVETDTRILWGTTNQMLFYWTKAIKSVLSCMWIRES